MYQVLPLLIILIQPATAAMTYTGATSINGSTATAIVVGLVIFFVFAIAVCCAAARHNNRRRMFVNQSQDEQIYNQHLRIATARSLQNQSADRPAKPEAIPPYFDTTTPEITVPPPSYQDSTRNHVGRLVA